MRSIAVASDNEPPKPHGRQARAGPRWCRRVLISQEALHNDGRCRTVCVRFVEHCCTCLFFKAPNPEPVPPCGSFDGRNVDQSCVRVNPLPPWLIKIAVIA
jgi:hypothetical protein